MPRLAPVRSPARIRRSVESCQSAHDATSIRLPAPEIRLDLHRIASCATAVRVQLSGRGRTIQDRDGGSIPAHPLQPRSADPAHLPDAPRAAGAARHRGGGILNAGILPVPGDEGRDRNVARMPAAARNPAPAVAKMAQAPTLASHLRSCAGGCDRRSGSGRRMLGRSLAFGLPGRLRDRGRRPEPV